jgi:hypothetical protein
LILKILDGGGESGVEERSSLIQVNKSSMKGVVKEKAPPGRPLPDNQPSSAPERVKICDHVMSSLHAIVFSWASGKLEAQQRSPNAAVARHVRRECDSAPGTVLGLQSCADSFLKPAKPTAIGHKVPTMVLSETLSLQLF